MSASRWVDDLPVIGKLPPEEAAAKLRKDSWRPSTARCTSQWATGG